MQTSKVINQKLPPTAGDVEALLETYDRDRRVLPPPVLIWKWGWTKSAETWNGRIAMLAIVVVRPRFPDTRDRGGRAGKLVFGLNKLAHQCCWLTPFCVWTGCHGSSHYWYAADHKAAAVTLLCQTHLAG